MRKRFPLPYSSLSSCYYGIVGKSCDWVLSSHNIFKESDTIDMGKWGWKFNQFGIILPFQSEYMPKNKLSDKLFLRLRMSIYKNKIHSMDYIENIEIENIVKNAYHISIYSEKIDINNNINNNNKKVLINKKVKWLSAGDIHHMIL